MKVGGPKNGIPTKSANVDGATKTPSPRRFDATLSAATVAENQPASAARGSSVSSYGEQLATVMARLRRGEISRDQARSALVEIVAQSRGATLPAEQREKLVQALNTVLEEDPYVAARLSSLTALPSKD